MGRGGEGWGGGGGGSSDGDIFLLRQLRPIHFGASSLVWLPQSIYILGEFLMKLAKNSLDSILTTNFKTDAVPDQIICRKFATRQENDKSSSGKVHCRRQQSSCGRRGKSGSAIRRRQRPILLCQGMPIAYILKHLVLAYSVFCKIWISGEHLEKSEMYLLGQ